MLKVATLFSGIGTPEQSLKHLQVEHETVFACEIDKYARTTYLANNQAPNTFYEDVYNIDGNKYKNQIDILIGGSPCQSFSIAGKRMGTSCPRGNLIYEYFRIVEESQPKVFIYENVKGFLSIDKGETFKNFVQSFKDLGYTTYHQVLNTKDYGVPQNRERIYIVGFKDNVDFQFQEKQELKLRLKDMLEDKVDKKYLLNQELVSKYLETGTITATYGKGVESFGSRPFIRLDRSHTLNIKGNDSIKRIYSSDGLCPSLTTMQGGHREPKVAIPIRWWFTKEQYAHYLGENCDNKNEKREIYRNLTDFKVDKSKISIANGLIEVSDEVRVKEATKLGYKVAEEGNSINIYVSSSKTRRGRAGSQVAQTLDTACNQVVFNKVQCINTKNENGKQPPQQDRIYHTNGIMTTISAQLNERFNITDQKYIFRKLTPRECFRLQGFDDSFIFPLKMSDTQLYKQAGNGMSRNILNMIFTQIFTCYAKHIENIKE
ncbi:DNA cytosine methyltransferase [Sulfurimonas sp.]|uniref:DNA cytosine methyltransferase n=1 Tax=Sulfurimonas sp. TaxID=2022749 RepID=UPI003D14FCF2